MINLERRMSLETSLIAIARTLIERGETQAETTVNAFHQGGMFRVSVTVERLPIEQTQEAVDDYLNSAD